LYWIICKTFQILPTSEEFKNLSLVQMIWIKANINMDNEKMFGPIVEKDGKTVTQIDENTKIEKTTETYEADDEAFENQIKNKE